jgi:hypothetical protein
MGSSVPALAHLDAEVRLVFLGERGQPVGPAAEQAVMGADLDLDAVVAELLGASCFRGVLRASAN